MDNKSDIVYNVLVVDCIDGYDKDTQIVLSTKNRESAEAMLKTLKDNRLREIADDGEDINDYCIEEDETSVSIYLKGRYFEDHYNVIIILTTIQ